MATKKEEEMMAIQAMAEHRWINSPVVYTRLCSQLGTVQQDIMLMVSGALQNHVKQFYEEKRYMDKAHPNPLIPAEVLQSMPSIHINLDKLNIGNNHYDKVDELLKSMKQMWVEVPLFNQETGLRNGKVHAPVFDAIFVPANETTKQGDELQYKSGRRRETYIEVSINPKAAAFAFDMSAGYINHLERIALWCTSCYTSRLYLLLMRYVCYGNMTPVIDYAELKEFLGMIERDEDGTVIGEKYAGKFSKFAALVLNVAKKDMIKLSAENKIEITLDESKTDNGYEAIFPGKARRGNPSQIKFYIKHSTLGQIRNAKLHREQSEKKLLDSLLAQYPYLDSDVMSDIFAVVDDKKWKDFQKFLLKELPSIIETPHRWSGTPESYVVMQIRNFIDSLSVAEAPKVEKEPRKEKKASTKIIGAYYREWKEFLSLYDGVFKPMLELAEHKGSDRGFMWIEFPDKECLSIFESAESDPRNSKEVKHLHDVLASVMPTPMAAMVLVRGCKRA